MFLNVYYFFWKDASKLTKCTLFPRNFEADIQLLKNLVNKEDCETVFDVLPEHRIQRNANC